jgi:hypothetical protein
MIFFKDALKMTMVAFVGALCFPQYIFAYIDPGTGSYAFQVVIAAFVAVSFLIKTYWQKIKIFIGRLFSKKDR